MKTQVKMSGIRTNIISEIKDVVAFDRYYDIVFKPSINLWNGNENLQLVIEDMRPCQSD